jgi:cysteine synthase A
MPIRQSLSDTVGHTPLIRLNSFSDETGCEILGKAEFLNPGGSVKDRAALGILDTFERQGLLKPGGTLVEGTAGNTGIGFAHLCNARGYRCVIVMPDNQSPEKAALLRTLGAEVQIVKAVPYADPNHYQKVAPRMAADIDGAVCGNQFDNTANRDQHYATTGPEIWHETGGRIDAFTCATGTGGTLGGVSRYLKQQKPGCRIVLADPMGSALYNWVKTGTLESGGSSSVTEGIGIGRVTANLEGSPIDDAVRIEDDEIVRTGYQLLYREGLFLGGTSGANVAAAVRVAKQLGPGNTVVTILCDGGQKYLSRFWNREYLEQKGLASQADAARRGVTA